MRSKTLIIISSFILVALVLGILYLLKPEIFDLNIFKKQSDFSAFDLSQDETIVVGCIFGTTKDDYICFNKTEREFEKVLLLEKYPSLDSLEEGFVLLEIKNSKLEVYEVDTEDIFSRWYQDINLERDRFFFEQEDGTHVDLYNFVQLKVLQKRNDALNEEEFKNELTTFRGSSYLMNSPMRDEDWLFVCEITDNACAFWEKYQEIPYSLIKSLNSDEDWDYNDLSKNWSRLSMLAMGLNSMNEEYKEYENMITEYEKFKNSFISNNENMSEEELMFIGQYLPLGLVEYSDSLYEGWSNKYKNQFYYLVDSYCFSREDCLQSKLNILYDEYKK